ELLVEPGFEVRLEFVEPGFDLAGLSLDQGEVNRAVVECARQFTEPAQDGWGEGFECPETIAFPMATTVGAGAAFVAGIEKAAQFFGLGQVGVDFVQEQGGLGLVDEAEENWCGEVFGADGSGD